MVAYPVEPAPVRGPNYSLEARLYEPTFCTFVIPPSVR